MTVNIGQNGPFFINNPAWAYLGMNYSFLLRLFSIKYDFCQQEMLSKQYSHKALLSLMVSELRLFAVLMNTERGKPKYLDFLWKFCTLCYCWNRQFWIGLILSCKVIATHKPCLEYNLAQMIATFMLPEKCKP